MRSVLGFYLLPVVLPAPAPPGLELVADYFDYPDVEDPTLVIVRPHFGEFGDFSRFPGFGSFPPTFGRFPQTDSANFGFEESFPKISLSLSDLFGFVPTREESSVTSIFTSLYDVLGSSLGLEGAQAEERNVTIQEEGQYPHHNNTYQAKVLPDGSVVRVNRTTIHDTDQQGNTLFFSSSVHHILHADDSVNDSTKLLEVESMEDEDTDSVVEVDPDYQQEVDLVNIVIDETENEVDFEEIKDSNTKEDFPVVDKTASVEGLFE